MGRPAFNKITKIGEESKVLHVKERDRYWSISRNTYDDDKTIISGRATNSPSSSEAGPSVWAGVNRWRYVVGKNAQGTQWNQGHINVTCLKNL